LRWEYFEKIRNVESLIIALKKSVYRKHAEGQDKAGLKLGAKVRVTVRVEPPAAKLLDRG
jgi:hypothetical protein